MFLNLVRGSNYFLCHPLLTWQTLHIFITFFYRSLFDGVGICIFVLFLCKKAACA